MRNLIQSTESPNTLVQHCATPIAPTLSAINSIESTCLFFDSLALQTLFIKARSTVSKDTKLIISISRLLTATSYGKESHPFSEVKVSVLIITYKGNKFPRVAYLPALKRLGFPHPARSL